MNVGRVLVMGLALAGGSSPLFARSDAAPTETSASKHRALEGNWRGIFGQNPIEFKFAFENGSWKAWWVSQKDGSLYLIDDVSVDGDTVRFTNVSKPEVVFFLKLDEDGKSLSGTKTFSDGSAVVQTLQRL